ncbi:MAG: hypothetical protein QOH06_1077 [Acidobacteriota bacterium]|jgi:hypothetical protein|nr:hypothetical protein [Acidobacteriota bacterium]
MLKKNWYIKKNILCSGLDPGPALGFIADVFGDEYTPMLFMTGDGHRQPPFSWTTRGVWPDFFRQMAAMNKVCCHVEKYSDDVTKDDIPITLRSVFNNGKAFGWEPDFYKELQQVMEICFKTMSSETVDLDVMGKIANSLNRIAKTAPLRKEADIATEYYLKGLSLNKDPVPMEALPNYDVFLAKFAGTRAMALRTEVHAMVGATIQKNIDRYADHLHLITCGDAHITCIDPLYLHIKPPVGTFGVADESKG